jgi:hypothetical protein
MAKKVSTSANALRNAAKPKRTSIGRGFLSKSMMNKNKRRSFKAYRGQGR